MAPENGAPASQGLAQTPARGCMRYARQQREEMKWWHRFRLAAVAVLSLGVALFFLYCLCSLAQKPLEHLEQTLVPEADSR